MRRILFAFIILFSVSWVTHVGASQTPPHLTSAVPAKYASLWRWTQAPWIGDDSAYKEARNDIEAAVAGGRKIGRLVAVYRAAAKQAPNDRLKLFKWGYSAYEARVHEDPDLDIQGLPDALAGLAPPFTYDFQRMHFLVSRLYLQNDYVTELGMRLAEADPKDYDVRWNLATCIIVSKQETRKIALAYAHSLIEIRPDAPSGYAVVGGIHWNVWILSRATDRAAAQETIRWFNEYLKREKRPTRAKERQRVQNEVNRIQRWLVDGKLPVRNGAARP